MRPAATTLIRSRWPSRAVRFWFCRPTAERSRALIIHRKKRFNPQLLRRNVLGSAQGRDCSEQLQRYLVFAEMHGQDRARPAFERELVQHLADVLMGQQSVQ